MTYSVSTFCEGRRLILLGVTLLTVGLGWSGGCASHPEQTTAAEASGTSIPKFPEDDVLAHYAQRLDRMERVVKSALGSMGCLIKIDVPGYQKVRMPWGETAEIFLRAAPESGTDLSVDTSKRFIGLGLQSDRRAEILNAIRRSLDRDLSENPDRESKARAAASPWSGLLFPNL